MTIWPVLNRALNTYVRRGGVQWDRAIMAVVTGAIVFGSFAAQLYSADWSLSGSQISATAQSAFLRVGAIQAFALLAITVLGAQTIALERDRRTLDFLLTTPLENVEILLGKLGACLILYFSSSISGFPVLYGLVALGGVDFRLLLLLYAIFGSTALFLAAMSTWISVRSTNVKKAASFAMGWTICWLLGPYLLVMLRAAVGLRLPEWVRIPSDWVLDSSPLGLVLNYLGLQSSGRLLDALYRMIALQLAGSFIFVVLASLQLRSIERAQAGGDARPSDPSRLRSRRVRPTRRRPAVGDDPILWRARYTEQSTGLDSAASFVMLLGLIAALGALAYYFAFPAVAESWTHGYMSAAGEADASLGEMLSSLVVKRGLGQQTVDSHRLAFNLVVRVATIPVLASIVFLTPAFVIEAIDRERLRDTWSGLLATPLTAGEILGSQLLAVLWRLRGWLGTLVALWTAGLIAGSIHPLGYVAAITELAATTWFFMAFGPRASERLPLP